MSNDNLYPQLQTQRQLAPSQQDKLDKAEAERKLQQAVVGTRQVLFEATTVFPFTLFPDTVVVDREKLTVTHRIFFQVAEVMSIRTEDILNVTADVGPFFGSLKISTRFFNTKKPYRVNYLWRNDALRIKRIVQGCIIARQKGIDCSAFEAKELANMFDELGQAAPTEDV
jgi:hypothetical protein